MKKSKTEKSTRGMEHPALGSVDLDRPQIINVQNYRVFVSTWNVGGESPPSNLNLNEWLHFSTPADIYVLGFQEIVPLNAGNILGVEDNGPAKKWMAFIGKTLNSGPGTSGGNGYYTSSPVPDLIAERNADFEGSKRHKASSFFHRRSFQTPQCGSMENDPSISQPRMDGRYSVCDRVIFGHRSSDFDPNIRWEQRQSDYNSAHWPSDYSSCHRESDYSSGHRLGDYSCGWRPSDFSRCGLSDDDYGPADSQLLRFHLSQMEGIYFNQYAVASDKFCFVCTHLTSGQKRGDELRRNSDHQRLYLNTSYLAWGFGLSIALSYCSAKALVEMQNWRALLGNDQLRIEQRRGRVLWDGKKERYIFHQHINILGTQISMLGKTFNQRRSAAHLHGVIGFCRMEGFSNSCLMCMGNLDFQIIDPFSVFFGLKLSQYTVD